MKKALKASLAIMIAWAAVCTIPINKRETVQAESMQADQMESLQNWDISNAAIGSASLYPGLDKVFQGNYSINFRVTDNNDGIAQPVALSRTYTPYLNLMNQDVLSVWVQTDAIDPFMEIALQDSDGTESKVKLANVVRSESFPAQILPDKWIQVWWHFKEYEGTVSGGDGVMDYSTIQKISFISSDGRTSPMKSEQVNFYLDDMSFFAEADLYESTPIDTMDNASTWETTLGSSHSLSTEQVKQGNSSIKYTVTNNNNGVMEYPSLYRPTAIYSLDDYYEMTFWIKPTQNLTFLNVRITDTEQTSEEFNLKQMFPNANGILLADKWHKGRIKFREDPGTIVGGNGRMDFSHLKEIVFVTRDSELPVGIPTDIYIDDLNAVKYKDRIMLDSLDDVNTWTTTAGSSMILNTNNYRDASKASVTFQVPNNNNGASDYYIAKNKLTANLNSYDVLSFWLLVSEDTDKLVFSMKDANGTSNYIRLDSVLWGSQLTAGKWWHIEWPFKTQSDEISGGTGVMDYANIVSFEVTVDDNTMVKGISNNYYTFDNLEAMTNKEWKRSSELVPMLAPTAHDFSTDDFQIGMYNHTNVQTEKTLYDMANHGVDFIVSHVAHRGDAITKNAALAQRLGLDIVRQAFPVANDNSLEHTGLVALASDDSNQAYAYDPENKIISYLNANELEVYWPNKLQSNAAGDFSYYANTVRTNDNAKGINRKINTHHINYLWYDTGEDHPWYMDWSTLGNYGGFKWTDRLKQTAWRMGKTNATNTQSWTPSKLLTNQSDRIYRHVEHAPIDLDEIADFKDSLWTNYAGGLSGVAFFVYDGDDWADEWKFVDNDGNPMNDRRWAAVTDMSKQIRAAEGRPYSEMQYPRSYDIVDKGIVKISALAAPSGKTVQSVTFEYNDGINDTWHTIGTTMASPYTVDWDTSTLDSSKKYFVRATAFDGHRYSIASTSYNVSIVPESGGPIITEATVSSEQTNGAASIELAATATGDGKSIEKIQYYVDTVQKPGQGIEMLALNGGFSHLTEDATATIVIPSLVETEPILIDDMNDISGWSGTAAISKELNSMRLKVSNNNNGLVDKLTAKKDYDTNLLNFSKLDTLSFWMKSNTNPLSQMQLKLKDSDGTVLETSLSTFYGENAFPADLWKNIRWNFKENYDSITGGSGEFNFESVRSLEISVDDDTLPANGAIQAIDIDSIRAFAETRWQEQTTPIIYVRAMDESGKWGPTQSIKINVTGSAADDTKGPATIVAGTNPRGITDGLSSVLLTANIDDGVDNRGGSQIVATEYFIDTPGPNGTGASMHAVDGIFDSMSESVAGTISTEDWEENSEHTIYVHGKDAAGNWGSFYTVSIIKTSAQGPRIQNAPARLETQGQSTITVRAIADESETGWGTIAAAEYFVDSVGFDGTGIPMAASDGVFSARTEQIMAEIDITNWTSGYHTIYVHAQDSRGKWGPVKGITVLKN